MNIHFKEASLFSKLIKATIVQLEVGSPLYGLQDEYSDKDILCIYYPFHNQLYSFAQTHHQLQYKAQKTDYLFVDVFTFIRNALSGDSTLNFEAIHIEDLPNTALGFLYTHRTYFYNYQIIKAYLGFANRDLKQYWQQPSDREAVKKYIHAERGLLFAKSIFQKNFTLKDAILLEKRQKFVSFSLSTRKEALKELQNAIDYFRKDVLTKAIETEKLTRYMLPSHQKEIDTYLQQLKSLPQYHYTQTEYFNLDLFYTVNENGLSYE
ncbi:DNA polymerase beta superfamily protein [Xanthocytophaga agilis]|uniref:Nucleotidyltransferase domain-containing protein n=1 Tax=Xanthocytophaga agilis TaxID=3048010 RepID=A0AAE3R848_9BACT|nr:nucleotidyltransferase domain-containing protein [Xanthocytophaga agilis]MDJ1502522.1 nucleotidyltransferase domain-containing protein [Xanthocytophaga agilis]